MQIYHQIAISCVFSYPSQSQLEFNIVLYLLGSDLLTHSTESQGAQNKKKTTKASTRPIEKVQDESSTHEESSSSDQEQDPEVFLQTCQAQVLPHMFMPHIEGPKIDWTVNGDLYHRFLKWCLKCENILECELAILPEKGNARKLSLEVVILE